MSKHRFVNAQEIADAINTANKACDSIAKVLDAKTAEEQHRLICAAEIAAANLHTLLRRTRIACHQVEKRQSILD